MRAKAILKAKHEVTRAECAAENALGAVQVAKNVYRMRQLARRRVSDIVTVLNFDFNGGDVSHNSALPFANALASGLMWEQGGDAKLTAQFISNALPCLTRVEIDEIVARSSSMSNQDTARLLGVNLEKRQKLGLSMIGACDLSDEEFAVFLKTEDQRRRAARKRRARPRNILERREEDQAKRVAIAEFASANNVSAKTIKNWITSGKATLEVMRENGVPTIKIYRGDAIIPNSARRKTPAIGQQKSTIVEFPATGTAGRASEACAAKGEIMHFQKTMAVGRAATLLGMSTLRALPAGFEQNLEQSRRFDGRLTQIDTDFADPRTTSDIAESVSVAKAKGI